MKLKELFRNRMVRAVLILYGIGVLVLLGVSISGGKGLPKEFPAVSFNLEDVFGTGKVSYEDYRGKPVILYFFASW
jgi:hypothetical protein